MRLITALAGAILLLGISAAAYAQYEKCQYTGMTCVEPGGTRYFSGVPVYKDCWRYRKTFNCLASTPTNNCAGLQAAPECIQVSSTCQETDHETGNCVRWRNIYGCNGTQPTDGNVVDVGPTYTITRDEVVSECQTDENNPNCQLSSEVCTEGPETRIINTVPVYKECWAWSRSYICITGGTSNDCGQLPSQCTHVSQTCISENSQGDCMTTDHLYRCTTAGTGEGTGTIACGGAVYCLNGDCETITRQQNTEFSQAMSWLAALDQMADEFDEGSLSVFKGKAEFCEKTLAGFSNCCKDTGWGMDWSLTECSEDEKALAIKQQNKLCNFNGTFCSSKVLGVCLEKKNSYCCFNSKLSRIINVQGRAQLGRGYGDPKSPDCSGLTISELEHINFSSIDLSEIYADLKATVPNQAQFTSEIESRIRDFYQ